MQALVFAAQIGVSPHVVNLVLTAAFVFKAVKRGQFRCPLRQFEEQIYPFAGGEGDQIVGLAVADASILLRVAAERPCDRADLGILVPVFAEQIDGKLCLFSSC